MPHKLRRKLSLLGFALCTLVLLGAVFRGYEDDDKTFLLPAATSHGHYQIELACETCHTPFDGVKQDACLQCHKDELDRADDSHPASKFRDPRNAELLERIDALKCVTCHREHVPQETLSMGVTEPLDLCIHCHESLAEDRPSHEGMAFTTCRDSGCHNFHDNRTLNEEFLERHLSEPAMLQVQAPAATKAVSPPEADTKAPDAPSGKLTDSALLSAWEGSAHGHGGANCSDCHDDDQGQWLTAPGPQACARCHSAEHASFLVGKHGMRIAQGLPPMRPEQARQPMKSDAAHRELTCNSCHSAHDYERTFAAAGACLSCHNDAHSLAYSASPHGKARDAAIEAGGEAAGTVSCATCHMPEVMGDDGPFINHNQNDNLRPNSKMLKEVCGRCHGIPFAIDALADTDLVRNNFAGQPAVHVDTVDMVKRRLTDR